MERISLILIGCLALSSVVLAGTGPSAGCSEVIAQNDAYLRCMQNFNSLFSDLSASGVGPDKGNATATVFCSDEGRAGVGCVLEYFGKCPHLMSGGDESGIYDIIGKIQFMGNINIYCDILKENCVDEYMQCTAPVNPIKGGGNIFSKVHSVSGSSTATDLGPDYENVSTFYSNVPKQLTILCGPMEEMITCAFSKPMKLDCPKTMEHIEEKISYNIENQKIVDGRVQFVWDNFPAYEEAKKYILDECPNLPDDFTNKSLPCIETSVSKTAFVNCVTTNSTNEDEPSCDAYNRGKSCIMKHVEPRCGDEDAKILIGASHLFSRLIPERCSHVGGAGSLRISLVTMVTVVAAYLTFVFA